MLSKAQKAPGTSEDRSRGLMRAEILEKLATGSGLHTQRGT